MKQPLITISIDGKKIATFESLNLSQTINDHHQFELIVDQEVIEKRGTHTIEKSKNWLGKSIVIVLEEKEFLGVVTNIKLKHNSGYYGNLVVSGYSKTILLEGGKHMQSWLKKDLGKIATEVIEAAGIASEVQPKYTTPFEYQVQYQESHFQFLQRLAKQHSEWLFYDGEKLIFGKPSLKSPIELEYGRDIDQIDISISAIPSKKSVFSYHPLDDQRHNSASKDDVSGLNDLGDFAFNTSKELFPIVPNGFSSARVGDKSEIDDYIKGQQSSIASNANVLSATSINRSLTVGTVIKVSAPIMKNGSFETKKYGEYIITSIEHDATGLDEYSNTFEAVSSGVDCLVTPTVPFPVAQSQIATVLSNEDPDKKGRVQVQFQWQSGEMKTSWVRVMSPDAGSSDKVGVNRGLVFIPEKDDQVMVGFRYNDPNRPFVMGSLFTGASGAGGDADNKMKSITTRSGSTIVLDEEKGNMTLKDAKENSVALDGEGNITVDSKKSISLTCGEASIQLLAEGVIILNGTEIASLGSKSVTMASGETNSVAVTSETGSVDVGAGKINLNASIEANLHSNAKTTVSAVGKVMLQGAMVSLN